MLYTKGANTLFLIIFSPAVLPFFLFKKGLALPVQPLYLGSCRTLISDQEFKDAWVCTVTSQTNAWFPLSQRLFIGRYETSANPVPQTVWLHLLQAWGCKSILSEFLQIAYWPLCKFLLSFPDAAWNKTFPFRFCSPSVRGDYTAHRFSLDADLHDP